MMRFLVSLATSALLLVSGSSAIADVTSVYLNVPMAHPERPVSLPDYDVNKPDAHDPAKFLDVQSYYDRARPSQHCEPG